MRREREMRDVSLEEISESTKIGTRSLRALEEEDFEKLPGGIFNKGFVRAYSRFLGLDEDQAVEDFDVAWKEYQAAKGPPPEAPPESEPEGSGRSSTLPAAMVAVVLLLIFAAGYGVKYALRARSLHPQPARQQEREMARSPSVETPVQTPAANPVSEHTVATPGQSEASQAKSVESAAQPVSPPIADPKPTSEVVSPASATSSAILLEVTALEDSWVSVSADGKSLGQGILSAQKSRTIRANKEVRLRLGNIAGVEVSFNGKPVNLVGEPKQVKELTFTAEGLRQ